MKNDLENMNILEIIELAKKSKYGAIWYSEKGPINISTTGEMTPVPWLCNLPADPILNDDWVVNLKPTTDIGSVAGLNEELFGAEHMLCKCGAPIEALIIGNSAYVARCTKCLFPQ